MLDICQLPGPRWLAGEGAYKRRQTTTCREQDKPFAHPVVLAAMSRCNTDLGKAPPAVGSGGPTSSRSRPHIGHWGAEAPATSMADLRRTGNTHERGLRHSPSTAVPMSAAQTSKSTLSTQYC